MDTEELVRSIIYKPEVLQERQTRMHETQRRILNRLCDVEVHKQNKSINPNSYPFPTNQWHVNGDHDNTSEPASGSHACRKVFGLYELVENILYQLPEKDLLLAQRINKTCRDVISLSIPIRKKLFLLPESTDLQSETPTETPIDTSQIRVNPIIADSLLLQRLPIYSAPELSDDEMDIIVSSNPPPDWERCIAKRASYTIHVRHYHEDDTYNIWTNLDTFSVPQSLGHRSPLWEGSWRHMYLSQPPTGVEFSKGRCVTEIRGQVTMDDMLRGIHEEMDKWNADRI